MTLTPATIRRSARKNRLRLGVATVLFASLLVGSLVATPAAKAAITGSTITTPAANPAYFMVDDGASAPQTFAISGTTSGGNPATDQVDINCYFGLSYVTHVAVGVPVNADGSFSVPAADLRPLESGSCQLLAVPHGTNPADLTPFAGPWLMVDENNPYTLSSGPNAGHLFGYNITAEQPTTENQFGPLGWCALIGRLEDRTSRNEPESFSCAASLGPSEPLLVPTRSELRIDGVNAYSPYTAGQINPNASELPAVSYSDSLDPSTGNLVIHESAPLVKCPDQTYPPTAASCPSFVSAGVTDNITITQDHGGHMVVVSEVFASSDGKPHSLDLLWDNSQAFGVNDGPDQIEYRFPGESAYSLRPLSDVVSLPATAGTIFARIQGAADGDTSTGQGAIVYDRPATSATFPNYWSVESDFTLHQTGTVPAGGSTRFRFAYVEDYWAANVASMAQTASNSFLNTLTVSRAGTGSGTVASSPAGISCGASCSHGYPYGTPVTLTATPATGSTFTGWSGACSGTGACTVTTNDARSVEATFGLKPETLSVSKTGTGSGTVTSSPAGISCGATCSHTYSYGNSVTLTATPATGSTFTGWTGACSGTGTCNVTTNDARSVKATFALKTETLTVSKSGTGSGTVTSSPAGISCGATCSRGYPYATSVTLTATPATGSTFSGWTGACTGTATCTVTTKGSASVSARFSLAPQSCVVPRLKGKSLKTAKRAITAHDCRLGKIKHAASRKVKKGHVIRQQPKPGRTLKYGAKIRLVVSKG